jgi:hypothetical protein
MGFSMSGKTKITVNFTPGIHKVAVTNVHWQQLKAYQVLTFDLQGLEGEYKEATAEKKFWFQENENLLEKYWAKIEAAVNAEAKKNALSEFYKLKSVIGFSNLTYFICKELQLMPQQTFEIQFPFSLDNDFAKKLQQLLSDKPFYHKFTTRVENAYRNVEPCPSRSKEFGLVASFKPDELKFNPLTESEYSPNKNGNGMAANLAVTPVIPEATAGEDLPF